MHKNRYKYVSIVSAVAVLLLLALYMWMTYRSVTKDMTERAGNQLTWAMFYESYTRADLVTADDTLSLSEARGNISLASSVEGMNDALSKDYQSEISLDTVALYVDSLLSVADINRNVTILEVDSNKNVLRRNNELNTSWSLLTRPVSIRRDQSRAIQLALNNPYPELAQKLSPLFLLSAFILGFFAASLVASFIVKPLAGSAAVSSINTILDQYKNWAFVLAFVSIGLDTNFKEIAKQLHGGKPLVLYIVGQLFNIILTFIVVWIALSGKFFPIPVLN